VGDEACGIDGMVVAVEIRRADAGAVGVVLRIPNGTCCAVLCRVVLRRAELAAVTAPAVCTRAVAPSECIASHVCCVVRAILRHGALAVAAWVLDIPSSARCTI
jgi:hypothetical protein